MIKSKIAAKIDIFYYRFVMEPIGKNKIFYVSHIPLRKPYSEPTITVNGQKLQVVDKFSYLGSTLSRAVHIDDEVTARTVKASVAFGRHRTNVWERNGIRLDTKLKVYKAVLLATLIYACETLTVYQRHAKRLNHFHLSCLRKLLKIRWQDKIPDTEVLKKAKMQNVHTL